MRQISKEKDHLQSPETLPLLFQQKININTKINISASTFNAAFLTKQLKELLHMSDFLEERAVLDQQVAKTGALQLHMAVEGNLSHKRLKH